MLKFSAKRRNVILAFFVVSIVTAGAIATIVIGASFRPVESAAREAAPKTRVAFAGGVTVSMTNGLSTDNDSDTKFDPGDTIQYSATIQNTNSSAVTGVTFDAALDPNTAFVPGSVQISPAAGNDSYPATGNVSIAVPAGSGLLANDYIGQNPLATITAFDTTSTQGGTVTVAADGSFTYAPAANFTGNDTFTYTLSNVVGSSVGTVTVAVSDRILFVDNAGAGTTCRPATPCTLTQASGTAAIVSGRDLVFVESGTYSSVGIVLKPNQTLAGQTISVSQALTDAGITLAPNSQTLAFPASTTPVINANGTIVSLSSNNLVENLSINPSSGGSGILGNAISTGTTTVRDVSVTAAGASNGVLLTGNSGATFAFSNIAISAVSGAGFSVSGGGTITATQNNVSTFNTISTTTGIPLNVTSAAIGASGLTFRSISSNGGNHGIILSGTTGNFTVTGDGTGHANGSGGTIQNIVKSGASAVLGENPVWLTTVGGTISLSSMNLSIGITAFSGMHLDNNAGGTATVNVTGCTFTGVGGAGNVDQNKALLQFEGGGSSNVTANVQNSYFFNNRTYGFVATAAGTSTMNVTLNQSGFGTDVNTGAPVNQPGSAITNAPPFSALVSNSSAANVHYNITNNTFWGARAADGAIYAVTISGASTSGSLNGFFNGNKIGKAGVTGSGCTGNCAGLGLLPGTGGTFNATINGNDIRQVDSFGIQLSNSSVGSSNTILHIANNTLAEPDNGGVPTIANRAIVVVYGPSGGSGISGCAEITGNTITGAWQPGFFIRLSTLNTTGTLVLPGLSPAAGATAAQINSFVQANNPGVPAASVGTTVGTGPINGGAACSVTPMPPPEPDNTAVNSVDNKSGFWGVSYQSPFDRNRFELRIPGSVFETDRHDSTELDGEITTTDVKSSAPLIWTAFTEITGKFVSMIAPTVSAQKLSPRINAPLVNDLPSTIGTIPAGRSVVVKFRATINNPLPTPQLSPGTSNPVSALSATGTASGFAGGPTVSAPSTTNVELPSDVVTGNGTSVFGQNVTLTATVAATGTSANGGIVRFYDGTTQIGADQTLAGGTASVTTNSLSIGSHPNIRAIYNGKSGLNGNISAAVTQTVSKASSTTTINSDGPDPSAVNQAYSVSVTVTDAGPGSGTPTGTVTVSEGSQTCTITLPATSCNLTSTTEGAKTITATYNGDAFFNTSSTTESHSVFAPPTIAKSFSPSTVPLNGQSDLTFTFTNPATNPAGAINNVQVVDPFPPGLGISTFLTSSTCGGTFLFNSGNLTFTGGTLTTPGQVCTTTFRVQGQQPGSIVNTTGNVTTTNAGVGTTATATLTVVAAPVIAKAFTPAFTSPGGTSTLMFTITNPAANTVPLTGVSFTDSLPAGMLVASTPALSVSNCGAGMVSGATNGSNTVSLSGASVAGGTPCTISVNVTATTGGLNSVQVSSTNGGTGNTSTATLTTCVPPPANMVAWYSGDGTLRDIAAGYDASISGTVNYTTIVNGKVKEAFNFAGTGFVTAGATTPAGLNINGSSVTIDGWIYPTTANPTGHFFGRAFSGQNHYALLYSNGNVEGYIQTVGQGETVVSTGFTPPQNTWTHLALVYNGTNIKVYANGSQVGPTVAKTGSIQTSPDSPFNVGGRADNFNFNGRIDEVEVFNRALLQSEIQSIYNADAGGKCKPSDLRVDKAHVGSFTQGTAASYTVVVSNDGPTDTSGTTTMTDTPPAGLVPGTPTAPSGWTCPAPVGQTVTCTSTNVIASGGSFPTITIPVSVAQNAALSLSNTASVSGGGEMDLSDDSDIDPTTIIGVAQTPSVTNASTVHGGQTTSGLVITPNAADGAEVTHFKITNIVGGTLFQNNGSTPIAANSFITVAQGGAGLKFTPNLGFIGNATFDIQASISNADAGLGGSVITATIAVSKANTTTAITNDTPDPSVIGQNYAVTAAVTVTLPGAGTPSGTITVTDGTNTCVIPLPATSCNLPSTSPGAKTLTATYNGDASFNASPPSGGVSHTVNKADTTATITADAPDPSVVGQNYAVTASVTVNSPGTGTPTGTIIVTDGTNICTITLPATNCNLPSTSPGAKTLTATYNGDANFNASLPSAGVAHTVSKADTTTTITADTPDPSVVGQSYAVTANASVTLPGAGTPTGTITVIDGTGGTCTITLPASSCNLTSTSAGAKTLTATYGGDANFNGSTSAGVVHQVNQAATSFTVVNDTPDPTNIDQTYTVSWTLAITAPGAGTPGGTVTVSDGTGDSCVATLPTSSCTLNSLTQGTKTLTYTYSGNSNFLGATNNATTHIVNCTPNPTVTNSNNSGPGSLRKAVADTCSTGGQNTITFAPGPVPNEELATEAPDVPSVASPISITSQIVIANNVVIQGPGANLLTVQNTAAASGTSRVFLVNSGVTATISGLTISGGNINGNGGGIASNGTLTLNNCTIAGNTSTGFGGGVFSFGPLTISGSTFSGNQAPNAGGFYQGFANLNMSSSTVSGNTTTYQGAGFNVQDCNATISNSTITGNVSQSSNGGIANVSTNSTVHTLSIKNSTVTGNTSVGIYGAIWTDEEYSTMSVVTSLQSTLVAANTGANFSTTMPETTPIVTPNSMLVSNGYNLDSDGTSGFVNGVNNDLVGTIGIRINAQLAPLANNGGPTQTHALCTSAGVPHASCGAISPAIDKGKDFVGSGFDQRGSGPNFVRPFDIAPIVNATGGDGSDIGAFELNNTPPTITPAVGVTRQQGSPVSNSTIATVSDLETPAGSLTMQANGGSTATVNGVTVSNLVNTAGTISANVVADCTATTATFTLRVTDGGGLFTNGTLTVTVTANTPPAVTYNLPPAIVFGQSTTVNTATATDNGSITGYAIQSVVPPLATPPTVNGSGVVSISNAQPVGVHVITVRSTDNCGAITDSSFTLVVNKANTATTIVSDLPDPTVFGQNYTVTAGVAVVAPGVGTPTGNITVSDGANNCLIVFPATSCQLPSTSVGAKTLSATYSGDANFNGSNAPTASHTVNKANSAVSLQVSMNAPVYGQTATMTATLTAVAPGAGLPQGTVAFSDGATPIAACQAVPVNVLGVATCSANNLGAGVGKVITATYSGDTAFNGSSGTANLTINKAPLNVTASSATVTYGDAVPAITSTITGFVLGETAAVLGTQPTCSTTYTQGSSAAGSQYPTSCAGGVAANYSFNYINGTVTVNKKALTVTADNKTRGYGAANPALTATFSGFIAGENLGNSGVTGSPLLTTTAVPTSPVNGSPYAITAAVGTLASANYSFATFVNGTLTITAAQLTVTADSKTRVFGAANPALTYQIAGFQNGETLATSGVTGTPAISTTATATSSPGTYPITVTTGTLGAPNYTFAFVNANLTVTQATTTTTITNSAALGSTTSVGQSYAVTWTTTPNAPGAGTPTGTVTVSDGTGATCTAAVAVGTCNLTSTTIGTKAITATYLGDTNFAGSTSQTVNHTVVIAMTGNVKQFIAFGTNTNLAGVTITISGSVTGTTVTDANGNYSFGLTALGGNYVLTPSGLGKTYDPLTRTYNNVTANISNADFVAYDQSGPNAIPREIRPANTVATPGTPVTVPIEVVSQGNEASFAFSLSFDTALLGIPTIACGTNTVGCTATINVSQAGRAGITIVPAGPLTAGVRQIARITFPTSVNTATSAPLTFGDIPTARDVRNAAGDPLAALYRTGFVSFVPDLEGDVVSAAGTAPGGDGVLSNDITVLRQMVLGLITPTAGQYRNADSAPRSTLGDGCPINATDVTQAARYNLGLDPPTPAGGPTAPIPGGCVQQTRSEGALEGATAGSESPEISLGRVIRSNSTTGVAGQTVTVRYQLESQGDEASASFTANWNPAVLTYMSAALGTGVPTGTNLALNTGQTAEGKLGVLLDSTSTYRQGTREMMTVTFMVAQGAPAGTYPLTFTSTPTARSVSSDQGLLLTTTYETGNIVLSPTAASVSVSGRVTTTNGQGLRNAGVTITDAEGNRQTTTTGSFGIYHFENIEAGRSYVIAVSSKRFRFAARAVSVTDSLADVDFVGSE